MKKIKSILLASILLVSMKAYADTSLVLPAEFLTNVSNNAQFKADLPLLERLLSNQTYKNANYGNIQLKDYKVETIINYFNQDKVFKQVSHNMLIEPRTGATMIFESDERCDGNACKILVDLNGDRGPNQFWTDMASPKDRIIFHLRKTGEGGLEVVYPNFR